MINQQGGFALVVVLWMLALLTLMAGGYSATMRTESRQTANYMRSAQAGAIAEAGIWLATRELQRPDKERRWRSDNTPYDLDLFDAKVTLRIQNEAGKIDLNSARPELLQGLLESVNSKQSGQDNNDVLQAILDWRDRDKLVRVNGAEDDAYKAAGYNYGAKNGPFNSIDELRLVMGMTDDIYRKIAPDLTIYSHLPGINPQFADKGALLALSGKDQQRVEDYLSTRSANPPSAAMEFLTGADQRYFLNTTSNVVTITSTGIVSGTRATIVAVLLLTRRPTQPYIILSWRRT